MVLDLSRDQVLAYRRTVTALEERLPFSMESLTRVAVAGLQDSMPRSALLSIHARVAGTSTETWAEPPLVQVWGPRYNAYVIAERDVAVFTVGRLSSTPKARERAEDIADRLEAALEGERMDVRDAAGRVGVHPNALRYAAPTGRFLIYWDGGRQPLIWSARWSCQGVCLVRTRSRPRSDCFEHDSDTTSSRSSFPSSEKATSNTAEPPDPQ